MIFCSFHWKHQEVHHVKALRIRIGIENPSVEIKEKKLESSLKTKLKKDSTCTCA